MTKIKRNFRLGRTGACEALLYEFTGRLSSSSPDAEQAVEKVAAADIYEGLTYLRRRQPDFVVTAVQCLGLITLVSGSPLD